MKPSPIACGDQRKTIKVIKVLDVKRAPVTCMAKEITIAYNIRRC